MSNFKISKAGMDAWASVITKEDVIRWHTIFTPWFSEKEIIAMLPIYDHKLKEPKKEDIIPEESKFEKLFKNSK